MTPINTVVFDLGRVLVDFSFDPFFAFLRRHGAAVRSPQELIERTDLAAYECGRISTEKFLDNLRGLLRTPASRDELVAQWVHMFEPVAEMITLLRQLRETHHVYVLSHTNTLHWEHLRAEYRLDRLADDTLTSFEAGTMKPDPEIFLLAARRFELDPGATVFVDDLEQNVAGARRCGWHAIHHTDHAGTVASLRALGVEGRG